MKHGFLGSLLLASLCAPSAVSVLQAQGTVEVQTLTFQDITKRRGTWLFPDSTKQFRKVLMYYTLKCDPATTADAYPCGEWDYLTYTTVYDKSGRFDSTYKWIWNYRVNGSTPEQYRWTSQPVYDTYRRTETRLSYSGTTSLVEASVGTATNDTWTIGEPGVTIENSPVGRAHFYIPAEKLTAAGLKQGAITGLRLPLRSGNGTVRNLKVRLRNGIRQPMMSALTDETLVEATNYSGAVAGSEISLQFERPFTWDGTSALTLDISWDGFQGTPLQIPSDTTGKQRAAGGGQVAAFVADFNGQSGTIDFAGLDIPDGKQPRTYEGWVRPRRFNDAGIFQAGTPGATGEDFSFRTSTTPNQWRAQFWGAADFDVQIPNSLNNWHHIAVTYDGTVVRVYLNAQQIGQKAVNISTPESRLQLGRWYGSFFDGQMLNFRAWNVARTAAEIADGMYENEAGKSENQGKIVGEWELTNADINPAALTLDNLTVDNAVDGAASGHLANGTWWKQLPAAEFPVLESGIGGFVGTLEQRQGTTQTQTVTVEDKVLRRPDYVTMYANPKGKVKIADDAADHPSIPVDTLVVWPAEYSYTYNPDGSRADSAAVAAEGTLSRDTVDWYSPLVEYEIGRFITPYGINLDLGPQGFRWVYDVTEFAPLLRDSVELQAGNNQELIDLKFVFFEGTPPADVQRIRHVWDKGSPSYSYSNLSSDISLSARSMDLLQQTERLFYHTVITGHGHESSNGNYPHCCEWKDNTHYLHVNEQLADEWKIWQTNDCAENPVFPQGGTWPGSREGWCPGDVVKSRSIDISEYIGNATVVLDYDISPVPANNAGMGRGNYVISAHLVEMGAPNHATDAELYSILRPSKAGLHSRMNPACNNLEFVIRNNGMERLTAAQIRLGVAGGQTITYDWTGDLGFLEQAKVVVPVADLSFWNGDGSNVFTAEIVSANGAADDYAANNVATSEYNMPDIYNQLFYVWYRTNNFPAENSWTIKNSSGQIVRQRISGSPQVTYTDTLNLPPGCYTFEMTDAGNDGLSYWANPPQGNGYLRFRSAKDGAFLKSFESDFGSSIRYDFVISGTVDVQEQQGTRSSFEAFPNPATNEFSVHLSGETGVWSIEVMDALGRRILSKQIQAEMERLEGITLPEGTTPGMYLIRAVGPSGAAKTTSLIVR